MASSFMRSSTRLTSASTVTVVDAPSDEIMLSELEDPSLDVLSSLDGDSISSTSTMTRGSSSHVLKHQIPTPGGLPKTIQVPLSSKECKKTTLFTTCPSQELEPFAQLCYDHRDGSIVTMMAISPTGGQSRRVPLMTTPESFPSLTATATTTTSSSLSYSSNETLSTLTVGFSQDDSGSSASTALDIGPVVLGTVPIPDIDDKAVYLLHQERGQRSSIAVCSRALKKLITFRALKTRKMEARSLRKESRPRMMRFSREMGYEAL